MSDKLSNVVIKVIVMLMLGVVSIKLISKILNKYKVFTEEESEITLYYLDLIDEIINLLGLLFVYIGLNETELLNYKEIIIALICLKSIYLAMYFNNRAHS